MFRNFRRSLRSQLPPAEAMALRRAADLWINGQPAQAADLFARFAGQMEASGHPRRAANLHARAAHAYTDARDVAHALAHARSAMNLFSQYSGAQRTGQFFLNITRRMRNNGLGSAADMLQNEFGAQVGPLLAEPDTTQPQRRGHLPPTCPQCGGPVRANEEDWVNDHSVECLYCGSLIEAR